MTEYWIVVEGKPQGPYTASQIAAMNLSPETPVWHKGLVDWVKLSNLPDDEFVIIEADDEVVEPSVIIPAIPQAPVQSVPQVQGEAAPTYLIWSVLSTLFCCMPLGIVAIIMSMRVGSLNSRGCFEEARRCSSNTELWIIASFTSGIVSAPFAMLFQMAAMM